MDAGATKYCISCFSVINAAADTCPNCNFDQNEKRDPSALPAFTVLHGSYVLGKVLGKGGFGITYLAYHRTLENRIVIKEYFPSSMVTRQRDDNTVALLNPSSDEEHFYHTFLERFIREAQILASLHHENIVGIKEFFQANGTAYFVMDYYEGGTIESKLADENNRPVKFDTDWSVTCMIHVLDALRHIHKKNIFHRDIKPDNIYLTNEGQIKIIDFGGAKSERIQEERARNKSTVRIGTLAYGAPEQFSGSGVGSWTDVYACGATLYQMLTGHIPVDYAQRLSDDSLDWSGTSVPQNIRSAVEAAMRLNYKERVQTAEEFIKLLKSEAAPLTSLNQQTVAEITPPSKDRSKAIFAVPAVVLVGALGAYGYSLSRVDSGTTPNPEPVITSVSVSSQGSLHSAGIGSEAQIPTPVIPITPPQIQLEPVYASPSPRQEDFSEDFAAVERMIEKRQYDMALGTVESILRRDPFNDRAVALKKDIKAKQFQHLVDDTTLQ